MKPEVLNEIEKRHKSRNNELFRTCYCPLCSASSPALIKGHNENCPDTDIAALITALKAEMKRAEELENEKTALQATLNHNEGNQ